MSTKELILLMGDDIAGTVTRLAGGKLAFEYDSAYSATPVSVSMPTQIRQHADAQITPWLWGLLPDNDAVLSRWSRDFHVSPGSPFSLLSTPWAKTAQAPFGSFHQIAQQPSRQPPIRPGSSG